MSKHMIATDTVRHQIKKVFHKEIASEIRSPEEEALARYGQSFYQTASCSLREPDASYHTTGEFSELDNGYVRHCGPTAMVNLVMTLASYYKLKKPDAIALFRRISAFGRRRHFYFNMNFLKFFGGTFNIAVPFYMKAVLQKCHFEKAKVGLYLPARPFFLKKELEAGKVLFVILSFHPRYGAHHLVVYGYRELLRKDGHRKKLYLLTADGWSGEARYLNADDLRLSAFVACRP